MSQEGLDALLHNVVDARMKELEQNIHQHIEQEIRKILEPKVPNYLNVEAEEVAKLRKRINWLIRALVFSYLLIIVAAIGGGTYYLRLQQSKQPANLQQQVIPKAPANRANN
jgi:hypothetical protein